MKRAFPSMTVKADEYMTAIEAIPITQKDQLPIVLVKSSINCRAKAT